MVTDTYTAPTHHPLLTHVIPAHRKKTAPALVGGASLEFFHNRSDFYKMKSNFCLELVFFLLHNAREYSSGISGPATFI